MIITKEQIALFNKGALASEVGAVIERCQPPLRIVQVVGDRGGTRSVCNVGFGAAGREKPQYINVARVADNFADDTRAYFDFGPSIDLLAEDASGTLHWKIKPAPENIPPGSAGPNYRLAGFDAAGSGIMSKTADAAEVVTVFLSSYGGDSFQVEVATASGTVSKTMHFIVWRRLWYDVVEMQRNDGVETFDLDNPGEAGMVISGVNAAFADVFIAIEPATVDDAPVVAEYEEALTDETVRAWERGLPRPSKRYQGLKFRYVIVNKYPEELKAAAFIRFETFGSPTEFSLLRGAASTSVRAVRVIEEARVGDEYWIRPHYTIDGFYMKTRLDQVNMSANIERGSRNTERDLSRKVGFDLAPDKASVPEEQACANDEINVGAFLLCCPERRLRCSTCPLAKMPITPNLRPCRVYKSSFRDRLETPVLETFEPPVAMEKPLPLDIEDILTRSPFQEQVIWPFNKATLYERPVFVELEVVTAVENLGATKPAVLGAGSAGSPHVFLSRGQIEEAAGAAGAPEGRATRIRQMMSRVGVHELGHALGLVAEDAAWRSDAALGHCGTPGCAMLPFDDPKQTRFHGEPGQPSCHHYLRMRRLERPF